MLYPFLGSLFGIHLQESAVEARVSIDDLEVIIIDHPNLIAVGDVGEAHVFAIPLQFAMQTIGAGQSDSQDSHVHHLGKRSTETEVGRCLYAILGRLLAGPDPVLLVRIALPYTDYLGMSALDTWYGGSGLLVVLHARFGQECGIESVTSHHYLSLFAHEDYTAVLIAHHLSVLQFLGTWRHKATIVPVHLHLGHLHLSHLRTLGECIGDHLGMRRRVEIAHGGAGYHTDGILDAQGPHHGIHDMTGHVSQGSRTKVIPSAPVPGRIRRMIRTHLGRSYEGSPVQVGRYGRRIGGLHESLRPNGAIGPAMHLCHLTYGTVPYPLCHSAAPVEGIALIAHLGSHAIFLGQSSQEA